MELKRKEEEHDRTKQRETVWNLSGVLCVQWKLLIDGRIKRSISRGVHTIDAQTLAASNII